MTNLKDVFVEDLKNYTEVETFFMVKSVVLKTDSKKKEYLDFNLYDRTGDVNAKKWDLTEGEKPALSQIKDGDLVRVKGQVSEWQGQTQIKIQKIRLANPEDGLVAEDYIKAAPEPSDAMFNYIMEVAEAIGDNDLRNVAVTLLKRNKDKLMYYPAATKNHHAEYGGLLWHMKRMLMSGKALCGIYDFLNEDLVLAGVIIHDMEKLNEIDAKENGTATGYSAMGQMLGHLVQGAAAMQELGKELGIPEEKTMMLQHMIISHHYQPEFGSPKKPMFAEAEILHYLDILDARMYDMEEALRGLEPGSFSDRVWTLDNRKVYKPTF